MINIRRVRGDDHALLRAVRLAALADAPTAFGSTLAVEKAYPDELWSARATGGSAGVDNAIYLAESENQCVGIVGAHRPEPDQTVGAHRQDPRRMAELVSMWVAPEARAAGTGRRLVQAVVDWAAEAGHGIVGLWVTEGNESARRLYLRCGFEETGERQPLPSHPELSEVRLVHRVGPPCRLAVAEDVPELVRLRALMFSEMGEVGDDRSWERSARRHLASALALPSTVAVVIDRPDGAGLACSGVVELEHRIPAPENPSGRLAYISSVSTDRALRRRGLARRVVRRLVEEAHRLGITRVELHATDDGQSVYRSLGFDDRTAGLEMALRQG